MKNVSLRLSVLTVLLSLFALQFQACKDKKDRDGEIQTAFNNKLSTDPSLAGVTASVASGVVTLTGTCASEACRSNAEKSVKDIDGVKSVVNNISVAEVTINSDDALRSGVNTIVSKYDGVQASVNDGVITVRGKLSREKWAELNPQLHALRPKRVENQLVH